MTPRNVDTMILHVDGDAFFAAVERAQYPRLHNQPVVVGAERGIATAVTYEAKQLGVTRGMAIALIKREFPEVTILPTHFELYEKYAQKLVSILSRFSITVERYSIDECFALISNETARRYGGWYACMAHIKKEVQSSIGITYSFGLAYTKVLAKIASKWQKPNGLTIIEPGNELPFLRQTAIDAIWGIGYRMAPKLVARGITTALRFSELSEEHIETVFIKPFQNLWHELHGRRMLLVGNQGRRLSQSIQTTRTFVPETGVFHAVFSELSKNIEGACDRVRNEGQCARSVYFFLKKSDFSKVGTEIRLSLPTDDPAVILREIRPIVQTLFDVNLRYRATGITLLGLRPKIAIEPDLFGEREASWVRSGYLPAIDSIRKKFGGNAIYLGSSAHAVTRRFREQRERHHGDPYEWNLPFPFLGEVR